jgi:hypothetical protein
MKKSFSAKQLNKSQNIFKKINIEDDYKNDFCEFTYSRLKHKIFLQKLLHIIQLTQADFLVQISSFKNNNKFSYKIIKDILKGFKKELDTAFKNNLQIMNIMEFKAKKNKSTLITNIFGQEKLINLPKKENKNNQKYINELPHLKTLNFKTENQLKYVDIKIKILSPNKFNYPKYIYLFFDSKNDTSPAYNSLHDELISIRKKFTLIVKYKEMQNINLTKLGNLVNAFKNNTPFKFKHNEYVNTSKIIEEDSDEYITRTGVCTIENFDDDNKKYNIKNLENNGLYKYRFINVNNHS